MLTFRRSFAAFVDLAFVLSYLLCVSFTASPMGLFNADERMLTAFNFAFSLIYFGCLDSARFGPATIGKRLCGIEVLRKGRPLPLYVSMVRAFLKFAVPVLAFAIVSELLFRPHQVFIGTVALLSVVLIFPISVFVAGGAVGIHDALLGTYVSRRDLKAGKKSHSWRNYWLTTILVSLAISFPTCAYFRDLLGPKTADLSTLMVTSGTPMVDLGKEIWIGKGSDPIQPFIRRLKVMPYITAFPTDYRRSFSKLPDEIVKQLKGKRGSGLVIVSLTENSYSQLNLRRAIIDRIASVAVPRLVAVDDLPAFIGVAFVLEFDFGPVKVTEGDYGLLVALKSQSTKPSAVMLTFVEPSDHHYVLEGLGNVDGPLGPPD